MKLYRESERRKLGKVLDGGMVSGKILREKFIIFNREFIIDFFIGWEKGRDEREGGRIKKMDKREYSTILRRRGKLEKRREKKGIGNDWKRSWKF